MLRNGSISYSEIRRLLRRYWWIIPSAAVCLASLGLLAAMVLPKKYTSSTMVLVEPPAVSPDVIPTVVNEDLYRHLASMKQQILSRSRLQPIIEKFKLYPSENSKSDHMEDQVERLKNAIEVELIQPMAGSSNRQPPGFHVSVTFSDPQLAMNICQEITSMFMEQNISSREKQVQDTSQFLTQQLSEARTSLDQQDAKLAQFKRQYLGSLPEEQQSNLSLLAGMNAQLEATTQSLSRAQQDKTFNESLLTQQESMLKNSQPGTQSVDTLDQQLATLQEQLSGLLAKYTPEHPDVVKLKAQIEDVKRKIAAGPETKPSAAPPRETPQIQQLRAKIKQDDVLIADLAKHQAQIQDQIRLLQSHVQASPMVEQQLKELTRNYQTALDNYNDLLKKQQKSSMAIDLEHQQQSETFRVLDAPSLPAKPSFPKKLVFVGGGFGAGIALGIAILYLLAMADKAMYTERDVELCLKLPVLTMVPNFDPVLAGQAGLAGERPGAGRVS
ncbi:MAG TPA: Wzz/FepE/Etk N-terminal domain-containing protein [Methylomirabilota bacterium]|nr:Wzz/FepE/Etk N-terminal domain-containing protein [Methylomirabilota bacterium]